MTGKLAARAAAATLADVEKVGRPRPCTAFESGRPDGKPDQRLHQVDAGGDRRRQHRACRLEPTLRKERRHAGDVARSRVACGRRGGCELLITMSLLVSRGSASSQCAALGKEELPPIRDALPDHERHGAISSRTAMTWLTLPTVLHRKGSLDSNGWRR